MEKKSASSANEKIQTIAVRITSFKDVNAESASSGQIRVQFWDKKERTARAVKTWGLCWLGAFVSIPFPLIHFVLFPGLILAGIFMGFFILGRESIILGGEGTCPSCQAALPIVRAPYRFPISDLCTKCQTGMKIEPASI